MSILYLDLKYLLPYGQIGTIRGDQHEARERYHSSSETTKEELTLVDAHPSEFPNNDLEYWDPRLGAEAEKLTPTKDLKEVQIGPHAHQVMKMVTFLSVNEGWELVNQLIKNVILFTWTPSDMSGIDTKVVSHRLVFHHSAKPVAQRKPKVGKEKRISINEEVGNLSDVRFITEIKYPTWLANVILVWKANNRLCLCVDFTNLNVVCSKDSYPLLDIDRLIDISSGYLTLSFMDIYSWYNQIRMDPLDSPKPSFM